jgi:hypothetical protein
MEIVLWGLIGLARSSFSQPIIGGTGQLSQALALIFVGVPVFLFHWLGAQRQAKQDEAERASWVRALFFYAALLGLLIPLTQNLLASVNLILIKVFKVASSFALLGGEQSLTDTLIAILMNGMLALYFSYLLHEDWFRVKEQRALLLFRRLYRYIWVLYALGLALFGVNRVLFYLFSFFSADFLGEAYHASVLVNGLTLLIVGTPLWFWAWGTVQKTRRDPAEGESLLRLGLLYFLSLSAVLLVLSALGIILNEAILSLLKGRGFGGLLPKIDDSLAMAVTFGTVWAYYGYWLHKDLDALPNTPRRAALNRLYAYLLAFLGLGTFFIGTGMLLSFVIDTLFQNNLWQESLDTRLATALSTLVIGLPLWLRNWLPMQSEAFAKDEAGAHARRSAIRKGYLYLVIFFAVVGGMISAVRLTSLLFESVLGTAPNDFLSQFLNALQIFVLFAGLFSYHWITLKRDGMLRGDEIETEEKLTALLIGGNETLVSRLAALTETDVRKIDLILQNPAEPFPPADALILPLDLLLAPAETLPAAVRDFEGSKFLISPETETWHWRHSSQELARSLRQLAEGEKIREVHKLSGWMVAVYILAGIAALEIVFFLLAVFLSL